jgi:hypothetical protein
MRIVLGLGSTSSGAGEEYEVRLYAIEEPLYALSFLGMRSTISAKLYNMNCCHNHID